MAAAADTSAFIFAEPWASKSDVPSAPEMSSPARARSRTCATPLSTSPSNRSTAPLRPFSFDSPLSVFDTIWCSLSACLDCLRFSFHQPLLVRHLVNALVQRTWDEPVSQPQILGVDREPSSQL